MKKLLTLTMTIVGLFLSTSSFAAIIGSLSVCVGSTTTLTDTPSTGGTWSSSDPSIAAVTSSTSMMAVITGMAPGTATITKWGTPTPTSVVVTVNAAPTAISGTFLIDVGCTSTLSSTPAGGTWTSLSPSIATVGASTGIVTGIAPGLANIRYTLPTGCFTQSTATISSVSPDSVIGPNSVCVGSTISLFSTYGTGTWSITGSSIATITSGGVLTGVAAGSVVVTHTAATMCSVVVTTHIVTVTSSATAGTLSGPTSVAVGSTITLSSTITGGTWSSPLPATATIGASTGVVTGVSVGTVVVTYTKTSSCGTATATYTITVTPAATTNCISGNVIFPGAPYVGNVKVWLIKYNPSTSMLTAVDSQIVSCPDTIVGYSFCGMGTDSFRVKASRNPMTAGTGYLPTYHASSPYWGSATVINHVAPSNDINKHIIMNYGTASTGPGFIGGLVTSGANKGTADGAPVVGLLVYCVNSITGAILQTDITNSLGQYSFDSLPIGEPYKVYPELINYITVPYPNITFGGSFTSMTNANFIQHTIGHTITPIPAAVGSVLATNTSINVFPNPASGALNVQWNIPDAGTGIVTIADITGRVVMTEALDMTQNNGTTRLNINGISAGMYIVSIKANGINYNTKIAVQ